MGRKKPWKKYSVDGTLPRGRFGISQLGEEYILKLDKLARKWGCQTLSEAAIELLKDAVDEELKE